MTSNLASPLEAMLLVLCFVGAALAGCLACCWVVGEIFRRWRRPDRSGRCEAHAATISTACPSRGAPSAARVSGPISKMRTRAAEATP